MNTSCIKSIEGYKVKKFVTPSSLSSPIPPLFHMHIYLYSNIYFQYFLHKLYHFCAECLAVCFFIYNNTYALELCPYPNIQSYFILPTLLYGIPWYHGIIIYLTILLMMGT